MSGETYITVVGNLSSDPELRFTPQGAAVANFTIASTPRAFDKATNEWKDQETLWMRCSIWRDAAEHVAETLTKGMRVMAYGRLIQRSWEDAKTGDKRSSMELQVEEVGPSLKYATAKVARSERTSGQDAGRQAQAGEGNQDPWATNPAQGSSGQSGWGN